MASHIINNQSSTSLPFLRYRLILAAVISFAASILIIGCNDSNQAPKVQIHHDEIIIDKSLIRTNNPERYQPSFNLEGALIPVDIMKISSPYHANSPEYLVREGDKVKKNQVIARMQSMMSAKDIEKANFEFLDIEVNNNKNNKSDEQGASDISSISSNNKVSNDTPSNKNDPKQAASENTNNPSHSSNLRDTFESTESAIQNTVDVIKHKTESSTLTKQLNRITDQEQPTLTKNTEEKAIADNTLLPVTLTFKSPLEGEVTHLEMIESKIDDNITSSIPANEPFMRVADTRHLQLVGKLPLSAEPQLSVGQTVNFTIYDVNREFTGQISHITPYPKQEHLMVRAPVIPDTKNESLLKAGMRATMTIEYGQVQLGVRMPRSAIFEADLSELNGKHTRPTSPIHGFVWVILQNQTLAYTPVEVVKYFPESDHFLVHGVNNDSLVCLADLPKDSDGKKISID